MHRPRRSRFHLRPSLAAALLAAVLAWQPCFAAGTLPADPLEQGLKQCDQGQYGLAIETLREAYRQNPAGEAHLQAAGALGLAYLQTRQPAAAQPLLQEAYDGTTDTRRQARYGLDLANLEASLRHAAAAWRLYDTVARLAPDDASLQASVALNRIPLAAPDQRLALLAAAQKQTSALPTPTERASFSLNLGLQALAAGQGAQARRLAWVAFDRALAAAQAADDPRLLAATRNQLAQMYEDEHRAGEALLLTSQGIQNAQAPAARDLLVPLEWRRGRLLSAEGRIGAAIDALQRAVDQVEATRQDIPTEYENGRSSFQDTLGPLYLGLADLLLQQATALDPVAQQAQLRRVRDTLEAIKRTELEDFLGSRCAVEGTRRAASSPGQPAADSRPPSTSVAKGTAVLYPVILPDRLELLVETAAGLSRHTVATPATALRRDATAFAAALRANRPATELAQRLYRALLLPATGVFEREAVDTVVVVPDSVLRLVPFGALQDGQRYAVERYAFVVVPAVTLPESPVEPPTQRPVTLLLAGVSEPGLVVDKLPAWIAAGLLSEPSGDAVAALDPGRAQERQVDRARGNRARMDEGQADEARTEQADPARARAAVARGLTSRNLLVSEAAAGVDAPALAAGGPLAPAATTPAPAAAPTTTAAGFSTDDKATARRRALQDRLALAGVATEIGAIARLAPSTTLLNQGFSVRSFGDLVATGRFDVVHIASHGVFGPTADATFLMAHDDLITIDRLQALLRGPALREHPVELLTLSACETAEGDDRAPLGMSGAALKAQAQSALGSLWPVSDDAAQSLMGDLYSALARDGLRTRAKALQSAQVRMIGQPGLQQPFFWAPFILVERRL